jgi:hypothetical protein
MNAVIKQGVRLDVDLAVALEVATLLINKAAGSAECDNALAFNHRLWRIVRILALNVPEIVPDRDALLASATSADLSGPVQLVALNVEHSRRLAVHAATQGALKTLLEDWHAYRRQTKNAQFGSWLLDRMEAYNTLVCMAA